MRIQCTPDVSWPGWWRPVPRSSRPAAAPTAASTATDNPSSASTDQGTVRISGQNFTEAEIVADMYAARPAEGRLHPAGAARRHPRHLHEDLPEGARRRAGVHRRRSSSSSTAPTTAATPSRSRCPTRRRRSTRPSPCSKKAGITLLEPLGRDRHQRVLRDQGLRRAEQRHRRCPTSRASRSSLAAAPDCKGRLDCEGGLSSAYGIKITKILPLGYASQQTYDSVIKGESQLGETSTTDGTLESQGLVLLPDDKQIQPAQNLVPMVSSEFLAGPPRRGRPAEQPDVEAHHRRRSPS